MAKVKTQCLDEKSFIEAFFSSKATWEVVHHSVVDVDENWSLGPRVVRDHLIYYLDEGEIEGSVEGQTIRISAPGIYWFFPGVNYKFWMPAGRRARIYYCRFYFGDESAYRAEDAYWVSENLQNLRLAAKQFFSLGWQDEAFKDFKLRALTAQIASELCGKRKVSVHYKQGLDHQQSTAALNFIHQNLKKRFKTRELAVQIGLNPAYFTMQFKRSFGITPQAYIKKERVEYAKSALSETNVTISNLAYDLGYDDIFLFSRQFKEVSGMSPKKWREQLN